MARIGRYVDKRIKSAIKDNVRIMPTAYKARKLSSRMKPHTFPAEAK